MPLNDLFVSCYKRRWPIVFVCYLVTAFLLFRFVIGVGLSKLKAVHLEIALQNEKLKTWHPLRSANVSVINMTAKSNQSFFLADIAELTARQGLVLLSADHLGELMTVNGKAVSMHLIVSGELPLIWAWLVAIQKAMPGIVVSDFSLRKIHHELTLNLKLLFYEHALNEEKRVVVTPSDFITVCEEDALSVLSASSEVTKDIAADGDIVGTMRSNAHTVKIVKLPNNTFTGIPAEERGNS